MRVTLSAAVTADGFLDDNTPHRLMISTPEDWAAVQRLRAANDAILVGAETLRRDNPSLTLRDEEARAERLLRGLPADIARVVVSASGNLPPTLRFFSRNENECYILTNANQCEIKDLASVISTEDSITALWIVTQLEKRGIERLLVEGGEQVLRMFLDEDMADVVRLAVNPSLKAGEAGYKHFSFEPSDKVPCIQENLGGMEVTTWTLHPDSSKEDKKYLQQALAESRKCTPSRSSYCVGAVIRTADGKIFTGYTHETTPTHHAEQEAIAKAEAAGAELKGAAIWSSMEPCTIRASEPESCTSLIIRHGFSRAVFALYEPDLFAVCSGALKLRESGIDVRVYPELAAEVRTVNAHLNVGAEQKK